MNMLKKVSAIQIFLQKIMPSHPSWTVVDHWPDDLYAIGIANIKNIKRLVYVSVFNKKEGFYDYQCEEPGKGDDFTTIDSKENVDEKELINVVYRHLID